MLLFPQPCYTYLFNVPLDSIKLAFKNYFRKTDLWLTELLQFICQKLCTLLAKILLHSVKIFLIFSSLNIIFRHIMKFRADTIPLSNEVSGRLTFLSYAVVLYDQTSISISEKADWKKKRNRVLATLFKRQWKGGCWSRCWKVKLVGIKAHKTLKYSLENKLSTHSWVL